MGSTLTRREFIEGAAVALAGATTLGESDSQRARRTARPRDLGAIAGDIRALADEARALLPDEPVLPEQTPAEEAREWLRWMGCYPTAQGVEMAWDPGDRAALQRCITQGLDALAPGDLFAVTILVGWLAGAAA